MGLPIGQIISFGSKIIDLIFRKDKNKVRDNYSNYNKLKKKSHSRIRPKRPNS